MPSDFPEFVRAAVTGVAIGLVVVAVISVRRWIRCDKLFPKREKRGVPLKIWILGTSFFGAMAIGSVLAASYSFAAFFGIAAGFYAVGLTHYLFTPRRRV